MLPKELYRASDVRSMDYYAIHTLEIPGMELMRRAGKASFSVLQERWPQARTLSVVCGGGNNGGDGYVVAQCAQRAGWDVRVYPVAPVSALKGDARKAYEAYGEVGGSTLDFIPEDFENAELIVDALLGTGLDREVTGTHYEVIRAMNCYSERGKGKVLALDISSGLHADTGRVLGVGVKADATITFIGLKQGLFTGSGPHYAGEVLFDTLETPVEVKYSVRPSALLLPPVLQGLPTRPRDTHKGQCGHVLVIGGDHGYSGAARMAAEAAARVGAGLVSVATRSAHAAFLPLGRPELMCHGVENEGDIYSLLRRASVLAVGPGLGCCEWGKTLFESALTTDMPLVLDADGLNLLAQYPRRRENWILTPHPGEAARLLSTTVQKIQSDRFDAAKKIQSQYGGIVVLKGSGTIIASENTLPSVCAAGNPGMATGGMGDVLTGVIAGLLAQKIDSLEAATWGVRLHAAAADEAALSGERGLLASDLFRPLQHWINKRL